ncbi:MAG: branched-chain amino acid ABC transporter permease [Thaumarchaeota archaeon]|nr:branched-chain amino acid ABC transporter permease [Candidatus Calditenuaceae archaeon]MDW8186690.1 branched-chain amino acid ABC transporter permease [Nitrososphaerota archaeon]
MVAENPAVLISQLPVIIVDGVTFGLQLALVAVGITMIFGQAHILNISHGEFAVIASVSAALLIPSIGVFPATFAGVALAAAFGGFVYKVVLLPAFRSVGEQRVLLGLFITLGLYLLLHGYFTNQFPTVYLSIRPEVQTITIMGMSFRFSAILSALISLGLLMLLAALLRATIIGKAIRAVSQNETGAEITGIPIDRMRLITFVLGCGLAGAAGIMRGLAATIGPESGIEITVLALLISVVGGVRSILGTVISGVLLGIVYMVASFLVGTFMSVVIMLLAAAVVLLSRPEGILGEFE